MSDEAVSVDPQKDIIKWPLTSAISEWPLSRNKHELRSFLRLYTYFRRSVKGFSSLANPLIRLTEDKIVAIGMTYQQAFEELKRTLSSTLILKYPKNNGKLTLYTDAGNNAFEGFIFQQQDREKRVIKFFSKVISNTERNYSVTRREVLSVVKYIERYHKIWKEILS